MTFWKQGGIRCSRFLPGFGSFFESAGIGIGGVLPIGTALVTEFAPRRIRATMIVMGVVGVALGGGLAGLVAAQFMSIYGSRARDRPARAAGAPSRPNRSPRAAPANRRRQSRIAGRTMVRPPLRRADRPATGNAAPLDPKMIRSRARTRTGDAPCFQRVISLFPPCYLLLEKSSKSLIPLSDCPFVLNRLPVFLGKSPCFREKTGMRGVFRRWRSIRWIKLKSRPAINPEPITLLRPGELPGVGRLSLPRYLPLRLCRRARLVAGHARAAAP